MSTPDRADQSQGSQPTSVDGVAAGAVYTRQATGLVRELGVRDYFFFTITSGTPLASALILGFFAVAVFPRMNFFLALVISGVVSIPVWTMFALFTARFPKLGGDYVFNSRILHPAIGFGVNLGQAAAQALTCGVAATLVAELALNPLLSIIGLETGNHTIASWAEYFTIQHRWVVFLTGGVTIFLLSALAAKRTKLLFKVMTAMVMIFALAATVDVVILLLTSKSTFIDRFNDLEGPHAYAKVLKAGAGSGLYPTDGYSFKSTIGSTFYSVGYLVFMGFSMYVAVEFQRAGNRNRQLGTMLGAGFVQLFFLLLSLFAFYHTVGENFAISAAAGNQGAVGAVAAFPYYAALATGSPVLAIIIAFGFCLWTIPLVNFFMTIPQKCIFAWSFDGLLPTSVAKVNPRTHTPLRAIAIAAILALAGLAFCSYNAHFSTALTLATFPGFVMMLVVGIAAVVMPWRRPELYKGSVADWKIAGVPILPLSGALTVIVMLFFMVLPYFFQSEVGLGLYSWLPAAMAITPFFLIGIGVVWWLIARRENSKRGVDLNLIYKSIPPD
jgi:amino acid transporter